MIVIIDASIAFKWIAIEPDSAAAVALIGNGNLVAPTLVLAEVGNALRKMMKRQQIVASISFSDDLARLSQLLDLQDERADVPGALDLACMLDHSIYDCIYLAMAKRLDDVLWTADRKFAAKVRSSALSEHIRLLLEEGTGT